jgi:hypothetical protein
MFDAARILEPAASAIFNSVESLRIQAPIVLSIRWPRLALAIMNIFDDVADGVIVTSSPVVTNEELVVDAVSVLFALTTCKTFPNPVAEPLFVNVTPDGTVKVSPEVPKVNVPLDVLGESFDVFTSLILLSP